MPGVSQLHLPGHNYVGPGSDNFRRQPVDTDDTIASSHDRAYASAKSREDIRAADRIAIRDFAAVGGAHGMVGAAGLGVKYAIESVIGVQYPQIPDRRRPAADPGEGPDAQLPRYDSAGAGAAPPYDAGLSPPDSVEAPPSYHSESQGSPISSQGGNPDSQPPSNWGAQSTIGDPMSGAGGTGGGAAVGSDTAGPVLIGAGHNPSGSLIFTKKFQIYTGGYQFTDVSSASWTPWVTSLEPTPFLTTPLAVLDPNALPWFMTQGEYANLPPYSFATKSTISAKPLGYKLPFATGETTSTYANSQTLVQCCYATGLNHKWNGLAAGFQTAEGDLTRPTAFEPDSQLPERLYGSATSVGANVGVPRHLNFYYSVERMLTDSSPNLLKSMTVVNVNDIKGQEIGSVNYTYNCAPLKSLRTGTFRQRYGESTNTCPRTFDRSRPGYATTLGSEVSTNNYIMDSLAMTYDSNTDIRYLAPIEKGSFMRTNDQSPLIDKEPPHLNIGCMPLQSNPALAATTTFADVTIQWEISTSLEVVFFQDSPWVTIATPWLHQWRPYVERGVNLAATGDQLNSSRWSMYIDGRSVYFNNVSPNTSIADTTLITNYLAPPVQVVNLRAESSERMEEEEEILRTPVQKPRKSLFTKRVQ